MALNEWNEVALARFGESVPDLRKGHLAPLLLKCIDARNSVLRARHVLWALKIEFLAPRHLCNQVQPVGPLHGSC